MAGTKNKAFLILEDGTVFKGESIGVKKDVISEIVFNTSMTGYLEVLTDPSYAGQAIVMTYPLMGNYGVCLDDAESLRIWADGFIVREISRMPSNFRSELSLQEFLEKNDIAGICHIDTRALTKRLREYGTMNGMITCDGDYDLDSVIRRLKQYRVKDVVKKVSCREKKEYLPGDLGSRAGKTRYRVALLDVGTKKNIIRCLLDRGCQVTVYPCSTQAKEILSDHPDGIMISNGPGDPAECTEVIKQIKVLAKADIPIFAICLGHQLMALAHGAKTYKMKYGHRGANHPVRDADSGKVYISTQNHGYVVDLNSVDATVAKPWFTNVNDGTAEGLSYIGRPIKTVQFHPEANAGPKDSEILFDAFTDLMRHWQK